MTPRKPNSFIPQVAEEEGLSKEIVEDIINFYWKEVRKILTSLGEKRLKLVNFGTFEARKKVLEQLKMKYDGGEAMKTELDFLEV